MNKVITRTAEICYTPETRILRIKILEGAEIELSDALQNLEATKLLTKNDRYLILVDGRVSLSVSREARAFAAQSKNDNSIASAMIITSTANKLIGNFYINVNKPNIPTRIFSSEEKAIEWLSGFLYQTEETEKLTSRF